MPPATPVKQAAGTIGLAPGWYELRKKCGFRTDAELAVAMGVDPATVYRIQKGAVPSAGFIYAALHVFGLAETEFHRIFRCVESKQSSRVA